MGGCQQDDNASLSLMESVSAIASRELLGVAFVNDNLLSGPSGASFDCPGVHPQEPHHGVAENQERRSEALLKLFMVSVFLPEGLSLFVGDFRLPLYRVLIIVFSVIAVQNAQTKRSHSMSVRVPSDVFAIVTAVWIVMAGVINDGIDVGLKGSGAAALEFTGSYYVFRHLLESVDSSVRVIKFGCMVMIPVVVLALLDPLTGHLFTFDLVTRLTGYSKPFNLGADAIFRNGMFRAMGPMEHSILFATACAWFGVLALFMFRISALGVGVAIIFLVGIWFSQARGPLAAYVIGLGLMFYYLITKQFTARWKVVGSMAAAWIIFVFAYSPTPVSTLLNFGGLDPAAGWYRQAIWATAGSMALGSPIIGLGAQQFDWWVENPNLVGPSMDSLWLLTAFQCGIPGSLLVFLTTVSPFWSGPIDNAGGLSEQEKRLSVALGIVVTLAVFLGFTVDFWGSCWVLLGIFPGIRAHLAEAAVVRDRVPHHDHGPSGA